MASWGQGGVGVRERPISANKMSGPCPVGSHGLTGRWAVLQGGGTLAVEQRRVGEGATALVLGEGLTLGKGIKGGL